MNAVALAIKVRPRSQRQKLKQTPWETDAEYADKRVDDQEKGRMVAVTRKLPTTGYALEVDGRLRTEFETKEGAWTGAEELKKRFPMLRVKVYDVETKTTEEF